MNRIERVRQVVDDQFSDSYNLLALRLLFPPQQIVVGIEQELKDLYTYPERLEASYRDEWRSLAIRGLFNRAFQDHWRSDQENLDRYLDWLAGSAIPRCIHDHVELFRKLGEVVAIGQTTNTLTFPDPRRQALMKLIWPDGVE